MTKKRFQENPVLKKISLLNLTIPWYPERCKSKMPVGMVSYSCDEELLILSIPHKTKQKMKGTGHLISNKAPIIECFYILFELQQHKTTPKNTYMSSYFSSGSLN